MKYHRILMLGLALACASAWPATKSASVEAQAQYQRERAVCMGGQSNQDRATCLKEASAAYAEARKSGLGAGSAASTGNVEQRCEALPAADRGACMARMQGQGTASGSAAAGGVLREVEQPVAPAK